MSGGSPRGGEEPAGPSHGPAVLDIGGDVGAAVVYTPAALDGFELEVRPADGEWDGTHTAVRRRSAPRAGAAGHAALFPHLTAGRHEVRVRSTVGPVLTLAVEGGRVTIAEWPVDGEVARPAAPLGPPGWAHLS